MLFKHEVREDSEVGRLTVGVPGLNAQIPVRASLIARVKKKFSRRKFADVVKAISLRSHVHVFADDDGAATLYLSVANMTDEEVAVERLSLDALTANGNQLNAGPPNFMPPRFPLGPFSVQEVSFRIALGAPSIRHLLGVIQRAQNTCSSPTLEVTSGGILEMRRGSKLERIEFMNADRRPQLLITCPMVQTTR